MSGSAFTPTTATTGKAGLDKFDSVMGHRPKTVMRFLKKTPLEHYAPERVGYSHCCSPRVQETLKAQEEFEAQLFRMD